MKTWSEATRRGIVALTGIVLALQVVNTCKAQSGLHYIPPASYVATAIQTNGETMSVGVSVLMPTSCYVVGSWGQPAVVGNEVHVDTQFWFKTNVYCAQAFWTASTNYDIGKLPPGSYTFFFEVWGTLVTTQRFSVPVLLTVRASQAEPQPQLCWNTATSGWYRVEFSTALGTPEWTPLTGWVAGNGTWFCTNDTALLRGRQKFYRIGITNAPQGL